VRRVVWSKPEREAEKNEQCPGLIDNELHEWSHASLYLGLRLNQR
jgi:hypothetical protein